MGPVTHAARRLHLRRKEGFIDGLLERIRQAVGKETVIIPGAAGAITYQGKILLVRHNRLKKWQFPGGLQEIGESIQQTVEREIREELGLDLVADWIKFQGQVIFR